MSLKLALPNLTQYHFRDCVVCLAGRPDCCPAVWTSLGYFWKSLWHYRDLESEVLVTHGT